LSNEIDDPEGFGNPGQVDNPEEEFHKANAAIRKYEIILKSTADFDQQERVRAKLRSLRSFRDKLQHGFDLERRPEANGQRKAGEAAGRPAGKYLGEVLASSRQEKITDTEVYYLSHYLDFFDRELLSIFSERQLRLDFQHSLERDSFYHRVQEIRRKVDDFKHELGRIHEGDHSRMEQIEMRKRSMKMKRVLTVETSKVLKAVLNFAETLLEDIADEGLICLNGEEPLYFEEIEGRRYLEGKTVQEALTIIHEFCREVLDYLNIPEFRA